MADWTTEQIKARIRGEATKQGVDPDLALAVATQESYLNVNAKGDGGRSLGLFQLQPAAAIDVGVNPQWRQDPGVNIYGGISYLKQKLLQSKGNVEEALRRYNGGGDPNYVQNVMRFFKPGVAEAAERPQAGTYTDTDVQNALKALQGPQEPAPSQGGTYGEEDVQNALKALQGTPATAPSPPTATSTPEQDAAYRQWAARQPAGATQPPPPASQTAPTPQTSPGASQVAPAPRLSLGDPTEAASETEARATIAAMRARPEQEPLAPSPTGALALGGGPMQQAPTVTDPAALLAGGSRAQPVMPAAAPAPPPPATPASSTQIEPIQRGASDVVQAELQRPHEAGTPLSAVPAIAVNTLGTVGGAALGAPFGPVGSAAGAALGGALATRANTAMGLSGQEKPLLETPWANVYPSDLLGAIPLGIAGTSAAIKGTVRNLPGANVAKHEIAAERLKALEQRTAPPVPSDVLWQKAGQSNTPIATADVWRTAGDVVRRKSRTPNLSADDPALKAAQDLLNLAKKHGGPVPIQELDDARRNLVPHLRDPDVKRLYGAVLGDMDNAVTRGVPGAADLRGAIAATRKEHSLAELTDLWSDGKGIQKVSGDITQVFGKRIRNQFENRLRDDKTFAGAFTPAELADIRGTLREVGKLTRITNPESQGAMGRGLQWLGRLGSVGYGAMTQDMWTGGMLFLASEGASAVLARAMQSPAGRWALREAIREGNGQLTHGSLSAIAALLAREAAPEAPAPAPAQTP